MESLESKVIKRKLRGRRGFIDKKSPAGGAGLVKNSEKVLLKAVVAVGVIHEVDVLRVATGKDQVRVSFVVDGRHESVGS